MILLNRLGKIFKESLKIAGFLCFSFPVFANELCETFYKEPTITTNIRYGNEVVESVPREEILKLNGLKNPRVTLGVTRSDFSIKYDFGFERYRINEGVCAILSNINFTIGYKDIDILIDDKYLEGSCEYNAIKDHEEGHVDIYRKQLKYYGTLILKELRRIAVDVGPIYFTSKISERKLGDKIQKMVFENKNIKILKSRLEKALISENSSYDSEEEYTRVKNLCKSW